MATDENPAPDGPAATDLLDNLRSLRERARADRRGYAFPLLLFGGLILLAPLTYIPLPAPERGVVIFPLRYPGPFSHLAPSYYFAYPSLIGSYWMLTVVGGMAATAWWYRRRALRFGVEADARSPFVAVGAVLAGLLLWQPLLEELATHAGDGYPLYHAPWLNLPIMFSSALLATAVLAWAFRPHRTERQRAGGVFAGVLLASLTFATVGVYLINGFAALFAIAVALLVLAWLERSVPLAIVGALFTTASILAETWLGGGVFDSGRLSVMQILLVPGLILVTGGTVAVLTRHGVRRG